MTHPVRDLTDALSRRRSDPPTVVNRCDRVLRGVLIALVILEALTFAWALSR